MPGTRVGRRFTRGRIRGADLGYLDRESTTWGDEMIDQGSVPSLMGSTVRDSTGNKSGKVGQVYLDDTTGQQE